MMRLLLVRHGETVWNAEARLQGRTDLPLSPLGRQQASALAGVVVTETVHALYASDLRRAWETAEILADPLGLQVQPEPRWREMAFGDWEGLTFAEIQQRDAAALAAWQADPMRIAPPGGETLAQVSERVGAALAGLIATCQERTAVLVAHGGPLRVLLCLALGLPPQAHWRQFMLTPGSLSELYLEAQGAVLMRLNDTHHLTGTANGS
jgi:alpha-ribazole phosphatase